MAKAFDPLPLLVRFVHREACGVAHPFAVSECPVAARAAQTLSDRLAAAGLALLPVHALSFVERRFAEMTEGPVSEDGFDEATQAPVGLAWSLYHELVRIRSRWQDGRFTYTEPMRRWLAEIALADYSLSHEPGVVGALIEPEPAPLATLFAQLGTGLAAQA